MIALGRTAAVLLCAGQSERFGAADKLLHPLDGKPLVANAADMLASLPFVTKIATVRPDAPVLHDLLLTKGFTLQIVASGASQSESLRQGLKAAMEGNADAILLALGDMPWVTAQHIGALANAADDARPAASQGDGWTGPPWLAPTDWVRSNIDSLKSALLRDSAAITADALVLRDVDRPEDLSGSA